MGEEEREEHSHSSSDFIKLAAKLCWNLSFSRAGSVQRQFVKDILLKLSWGIQKKKTCDSHNVCSLDADTIHGLTSSGSCTKSAYVDTLWWKWQRNSTAFIFMSSVLFTTHQKPQGKLISMVFFQLYLLFLAACQSQPLSGLPLLLSNTFTHTHTQTVQVQSPQACLLRWALQIEQFRSRDNSSASVSRFDGYLNVFTLNMHL